jgi:pimeloyl-ACP methyl ester carboxylesterase
MSEPTGRNGVYGGWTHAGKHRVYVRVPTALKERSLNGGPSSNGNGASPELETTPIVLVHGLSSSRALKPVIRALGKQRPVFAPDLPGFGMSDQPVRPLGVSGLADALRRWLLDNGLAPAVVIGFSFGCQIAADLAARHPELVERLALVGPTFDPEARTPSRLAMRWARNAHRASPRLAPAVVHDVIDAGPWRSVRTLQRALEDPFEEKLGDIEAPTLVIRPENDHLAPESWTKRVARLIPDAELVVLPKAAHTIGPRAAPRLAALLGPFLAEIREESRWRSSGIEV